MFGDTVGLDPALEETVRLWFYRLRKRTRKRGKGKGPWVGRDRERDGFTDEHEHDHEGRLRLRAPGGVVPKARRGGRLAAPRFDCLYLILPHDPRPPP